MIVSERQTAFAKFGSIVKRKNFSQMDVGITAEHFCLQATEEGLGTCMLGWFNEKKVKKLLSIPSLREWNSSSLLVILLMAKLLIRIEKEQMKLFLIINIADGPVRTYFPKIKQVGTPGCHERS